ncbi:hypothetical protein VIBNISOn1_1160025 [Vibrio nigripulchritudo SOn1]|uniref:Uncharacterized protein n=1 Tax=Vibrio nigripulchritudo SOn1 TaxID=1238450 RepID=A0AAV2VIP3_9VIBR|nr:hypothetical protein VIBNISOn1_1160025 [Vibrio nigripulchritudo SOn1]
MWNEEFFDSFSELKKEKPAKSGLEQMAHESQLGINTVCD